MYLLNVKATATDDKLAPVKASHGDWVKKGFEKGWFLFAGPKTKMSGGIILVKAISKMELNDFINEDPYVTENVATYDVTEFDIKATIPALDVLKG